MVLICHIELKVRRALLPFRFFRVFVIFLNSIIFLKKFPKTTHTINQSIVRKTHENNCFSDSLIWQGELNTNLSDFSALIEERLGRIPQVFGKKSEKIQRIAWCTGAAQGFISDAIELCVDLYLSGEVSEQMKEEAPNISAILGTAVGARILAHAGSLKRLATDRKSVV